MGQFVTVKKMGERDSAWRGILVREFEVTPEISLPPVFHASSREWRRDSKVAREEADRRSTCFKRSHMFLHENSLLLRKEFKTHKIQPKP